MQQCPLYCLQAVYFTVFYILCRKSLNIGLNATIVRQQMLPDLCGAWWLSGYSVTAQDW